MATVEGPLLWATYVSLVLFGVALLLALVRLVRGPSLPDRVVALDVIAFTVVALAAVYAVMTAQPVFLDVGLVLALIAFLGTIAFARYVERQYSSVREGP